MKDISLDYLWFSWVESVPNININSIREREEKLISLYRGVDAE